MRGFERLSEDSVYKRFLASPGRAKQEGVKIFTALLLAENYEMKGLLEKLGGYRLTRGASSVIEAEGDL